VTLPPSRKNTLTTTPSRPPPVTTIVRSADDSSSRPRSARRTGERASRATASAVICSGSVIRPSTSSWYCSPSADERPTAATMFAALSVSRTARMPTPA
jgi:hypothetical protein